MADGNDNTTGEVGQDAAPDVEPDYRCTLANERTPGSDGFSQLCGATTADRGQPGGHLRAIDVSDWHTTSTNTQPTPTGITPHCEVHLVGMSVLVLILASALALSV